MAAAVLLGGCNAIIGLDTPYREVSCPDAGCAGACREADAGTGTPCNDSGGHVCNGSGACVACNAHGDCAGGDFCWLNACVSLTAVSTGGYHTCALTTAGGVQCWGFNASGELGNDSTTQSAVPVPVTGLSSGVKAVVAAGQGQSCALTTAGAVRCWGNNSNGQLGNGSTTDSHVPAAVTGLSSGVAAIAAGDNHTCAVTTAGAARCWGDNSNGQLGDGSTTQSAVPVAVAGLSSGVKAIAAGGYHTCALTTAGAVRCWGANAHGELGNDSATDSPVSVPVSGLSSGAVAIAVAGGYPLGNDHSCALTSTGRVLCWGSNNQAQLGNDSYVDHYVPTAVLGSGAAITLGIDHACALTTSGGVECWGANSFGQFGNDTTDNSPSPVAAELPSGVAAVATGYFHTCLLTTGNAVQCSGSGTRGQLGNGSLGETLGPVPVVEP